MKKFKSDFSDKSTWKADMKRHFEKMQKDEKNSDIGLLARAIKDYNYFTKESEVNEFKEDAKEVIKELYVSRLLLAQIDAGEKNAL